MHPVDVDAPREVGFATLPLRAFDALVVFDLGEQPLAATPEVFR